MFINRIINRSFTDVADKLYMGKWNQTTSLSLNVLYHENIHYLLYIKKKNIKTNLIEEYVNFVDNTKKQNKFFIMNIFIFLIILSLFSIFFFKKSNRVTILIIKIHANIRI